MLGKVNKAGEFPLVGRTTVMQALVLRAAFSIRETRGDQDPAQELATAGGKSKTHEVVLTVNYKAIRRARVAAERRTQGSDVVVVP